MADLDKDRVLEVLNHILELELAGVVRYMHYSFMVFGHARIPITSWLRAQATESMTHAEEAGELITALGGHPSLGIGKLLETQQHNIDAILKESIEHERESVALYHRLLDLVRDRDVRLEEYARTKIFDEENHISEVEKMLRRPGDLTPATEKV